jgi:2-succinyl-5-enolpyruvyl-6-hydroxy-3-cyclohexene-1-carboxylate synthase
VRRLLEHTERGLVILGRLRGDAERSAVSGLIQTLGWPVCADITSGLRLGTTSRNIIAQSDILVSHGPFAKGHRPEVVLHLGGRFVSKKLAAFLQDSVPAEYVLVADHPQRQDPGHEVTLRIEADLKGLCDTLAQNLPRREASRWTASWHKAMDTIQPVLGKFEENGTELSEPICAHLISRHIPPTHGLFLASSMPVRDMDLFGNLNGPGVRVGANRGASGVDGTIATATGFARGLEHPVTLLTGDLAFLHDLNSLNLVRKSPYPIVIVVMNNDGGGIFSFLPIARFEHCFETYFTTPHGLTFKPAADMYGLLYYHPKTREEFIGSYGEAMEKGISAILEIKINRKDNHALHMQLIKDMQDALET